ncbi:peptide ABC transporter permease [Azoarcus sp. DD4]|uniref:ABC transporter permease n=1 Tax=Azoarcus sp. DD4 TaxID=2027405 RepID=UPI00112664CA|nr:ABC transporter permease [Azoarcus sp. DD4]QDF96769.1 peptide ABC transporter permease [Azoarcus sp. DD4]
MRSFQPVLLWTDLLLFVLLAAGVLIALHVRANPPLREAWRKVGQRPTGMASACVLLAFIAVGLLDSLHYRPALPTVDGDAARSGPTYSAEVLSVLDHLLADLRLNTEKTYSAPFASTLYQRETVELAGGGQARIYPRLQYGGAHLPDPDVDTADDVGRRLLTAVGGSMLASALLFCLLATALASSHGGWIVAAKALVQGRTSLAWRAALLASGLLLLVVAVAGALAPYYHVLGTDKVGQDVLYLALKSVRTALVIGTITTLVMLPFAVALGIAAGYLGGWVDDAIQYVYTVLNAIPGVLLIAAAVLMMQVVIDTHPHWFGTAAERSDARLLALCFILGITSWTGLCRLLRGETLKLRELEYVQAARAFGVGTAGILRRHILPNVMHIVLIALVMDFSGLVLAEAVLSYVGIGVDPTTISFGTMINMARAELAREPMVWWSLAAAFVFMFVLVLAANLFADVVRDAFDPRRR